MRHKRGEYGWVKLSDDEYARLIEEHGQTVASHYIQLIDERAQTTGNKNKWKDWNLTVRRAIREKWGGGITQDYDDLDGTADVMEQLYGGRKTG